MTLDIAIEARPISHGREMPANAGAVVRFEGRVRGAEGGKPIRALVYEAYQPLAEREMEKILRALGEKFPCLSVRVRHRTGEVPVGEIAILVETCATHRAAAFALTAAFMDRLKEQVPIWKMKAIPV